jgi:hypothetical protein
MAADPETVASAIPLTCCSNAADSPNPAANSENIGYTGLPEKVVLVFAVLPIARR